MTDVIYDGDEHGRLRVLVSERGRVRYDHVQAWTGPRKLEWIAMGGGGHYDPIGTIANVFEFSHAVPVGVFALPSAAWMVVRLSERRRGRGRRLRGLCVACGYDLRGNSPGQCPECGTARGD